MAAPRKNENRPEQLTKLQTAFAAHIRNPEGEAAPDGIEDRRMAIYRRLFFNNINKFLSSNFPVLRRLYEDQEWHSLVRDFYRDHHCRTPLFPELPKEFLRYLQDVRGHRPGDPPFLLELAHYEWVELALSLDENEVEHAPDVDVAGDLMDAVPVLSPLAWPLSYSYPVHRIRPGYTPQTPPDEPTHILAWRDRDDNVKFMQLNGVARLLLDHMHQGRRMTGRQMLSEVAAVIGHPNPDSVIENGATLLENLRRKDILLGSRPAEKG